MAARSKILGQLLVEGGELTDDALAAAIEEQRATGRRLGEVLVRRGLADEAAIARALSVQLNLPIAEPPLQPESAALALVRPELARERRVLPLTATARHLRLAMVDPLDLATIDDIQFQTGRRVEPLVAPATAVAEAVALAYGGELSAIVRRLPGDRSGDGTATEIERAASAAPIVRLVDLILRRAVEERASDIHIERHDGELHVRYRVDGVLHRAMDLPPASHPAVISRIKVMAGMDIAVKRRPQDGRSQLSHGATKLTLRVSTLPTAGGEKAVIRLLDPADSPRNLDVLGLALDDLVRIRSLLATEQGVILAAGPTGSGKTSTLFGALGELDRTRLNIVTLEDPIEYRLPGISQVQVHPRAGLTFATALRAILRQDPDVVMVGEIRDTETAEIAMSAATTGHLVLSTIHTNDAPGAIARLLHMGVPAYLVAAGLSGVIAQRLVRKICVACRGVRAACDRCHDGHHGRTGVFEVLAVNDAVRAEIARGAPLATLRSLAAESGMRSMARDARRKAHEGITSPDEIARVTRLAADAVLPCPDCGDEIPPGALGCPGCGKLRRQHCACGRELEDGWRYCPNCLRPVRR
ncbi:MAG: Flp pilus assembly complex ATPase component TadA [Gemmatimonadetes bacterium]|nr:Flp pilus assembly complex ATPase component TadA [Gemmatimonadota bacterium]